MEDNCNLHPVISLNNHSYHVLYYIYFIFMITYSHENKCNIYSKTRNSTVEYDNIATSHRFIYINYV